MHSNQIPSLAPNGPNSGSMTNVALTAPDASGTYYYFACVEAVVGETNTNNNCSSGVSTVVTDRPIPDLVVQVPTGQSDPP